jgi:hypothetical protein
MNYEPTDDDVAMAHEYTRNPVHHAVFTKPATLAENTLGANARRNALASLF